MEGKFVKERFWWILGLLLLFLMSFTKLPLWNDGAHFLFRLYENNLPYIDPFWNRWVDTLIQVPAWISVLIFGPGPFTMWIFKISLLMLPPLILMMWIHHLIKQQERKAVILSSYALAWLLPLVLLFPITSIVPTLLASTFILSLIFKKHVDKLDFYSIAASHVVIFFGHEIGILVLLVMLIFGIVNREKLLYNRIKGSLLFLLEGLLLGMIILFKHRTWEGKFDAVSSSFNFDDLANYPTIILLIPIVSLIMVFASPLIKRSLGGLLLCYIFGSIFILWGNNFYHLTLLSRVIVLPLLLIVFLILYYKKEIPELDHLFWGSSFLFLLVFLLKGNILWNELDQRLAPYKNSSGCTVVNKDLLLPWSVPEWSLPYLSIIDQHTYNPSYLLVSEDVSRNGHCLQLGSSLIVGHGVAYNVENFTKKIRFPNELYNGEQLQITVPFKKGHPLVRLYTGESVEIHDRKMANCLRLKLKVLSHSKVTLFSNQKAIWKKYLISDLHEEILIDDSYPLKLSLGKDPKIQVIQIDEIKACSP